MEDHNVSIHLKHVGIAVESVESSEPILSTIGCQKILEDTVDGELRWALYRLGGNSRIELIEPISENSFLTQYLASNGPGLHHITFEVGDIDRIIDILEADDWPVIDYIQRSEWTEAFVSPQNPTGTLFQFLEYHASYEQRHQIPPEELFIAGCRLSE